MDITTTILCIVLIAHVWEFILTKPGEVLAFVPKWFAMNYEKYGHIRAFKYADKITSCGKCLAGFTTLIFSIYWTLTGALFWPLIIVLPCLAIWLTLLVTKIVTALIPE